MGAPQLQHRILKRSGLAFAPKKMIAVRGVLQRTNTHVAAPCWGAAGAIEMGWSSKSIDMLGNDVVGEVYSVVLGWKDE